MLRPSGAAKQTERKRQGGNYRIGIPQDWHLSPDRSKYPIDAFNQEAYQQYMDKVNFQRREHVHKPAMPAGTPAGTLRVTPMKVIQYVPVSQEFSDITHNHVQENPATPSCSHQLSLQSHPSESFIDEVPESPLIVSTPSAVSTPTVNRSFEQLLASFFTASFSSKKQPKSPNSRLLKNSTVLACDEVFGAMTEKKQVKEKKQERKDKRAAKMLTKDLAPRRQRRLNKQATTLIVLQLMTTMPCQNWTTI